jgi:outer membrane protein OmpA-like peptidoglycan-associated protein
VKSHNFVTNNYAVTQHDYDVLMAKYEECHNRPAEVKEVPVEKLVEKEVVKTVDVLTYFGETYILFPSGNKTLNADAKARLDQFAKHVDGKVYVNVLGSADSKTGSKSYNYDLAAARAKAVKDYLVKKCGVAEDDVVINTTLDATDTIKTSRSAVLTIVVKDEN